MQQFKIPAEGVKGLIRKVYGTITLLISATFIGSFLFFYLSDPNRNLNVPTLFPLILLVIGVISFILYRGMKRQKATLESYILIFEEGRITRELLNVPTVAIRHEDIEQIVRYKNGMGIKGKDTDFIFIPTQIDQHQTIENTLENLRPISMAQEISFFDKYQQLSSLLAGGFALCVYLADNKAIVLSAGIIAIAYFVWSLVRIFKGKHTEERTKKSTLGIFLAFAFVIVCMFYKLTGNTLPFFHK